MEKVREICVDCKRYWEQVRGGPDEDEPLCWKCYYARDDKLDIYYIRLKELDSKLEGADNADKDTMDG